MNRRAAGALIITTALLGALVMSVVVRSGVPGIAARGPLPTPPAIGSCVVRTSMGISAVGCNQPHAAEVSGAWNADTPGPRVTSPYEACQAATSSYLGGSQGWTVPDLSSDRWGTPSVRFVVDVAQGPTTTLIPGWSWHACLLAPVIPEVFQAGYTGRLLDVSIAQPPASVALRSCYTRLAQVRGGIACGDDHIGEILANRQIQLNGQALPSTDTDPARIAECTAVARADTGAADPTFGGRLAVVVSLDPIGGGGQDVGAAAGSGAPTYRIYTTYKASCSLEVRGRGSLYESLIGVGSGPLPLH